jgi:peptidoglycan/LPS O-acetylase OafA/YrhL
MLTAATSVVPPPATGFRVKTTRVPAIDGLRAISIIGVVGFHGSWRGFSNGGLGVDLFFVISGYLITSLLLNEQCIRGQVNLRAFYARRFFRIIPALAVYLLGFSLLCVVVYKDFLDKLLLSLACAAFFVTNIAIGWFDVGVLAAHTWSLSMEEQFYLVFPWLLRCMTYRRLTLMALAVAILTPLWRAALFLVVGPENLPPHRFAYSPDTRLDTIAMGCLLALLLHKGRQRAILARMSGSAAAFVCGAAVIAASCYFSSIACYRYVLHSSVVAVACTMLVAWGAHSSLGLLNAVVASWPMVYCGRISYSLYLWHPAILGIAHRASPHLPPRLACIGDCFIYVGLTLAVAMASYHLVELSALRIKQRYSV